jgi:hypothetical protein
MTRCSSAGPILALAVALPGLGQPRQLKDFSQLCVALKAGAQVRAVFHYKAMKLFVNKREQKEIPDAVGGLDVGAFEYFAPGAAGNKEAFLTFSHTQLIKHARYGTVFDYLKVSVFESNKVRIVVQYLAPGTYAVRMDEYFDAEINDGKNNAGAYFYLVGSAGTGRDSP